MAVDSNAENMNTDDTEPGEALKNAAIKTNSKDLNVEAPLDGIDGAGTNPFVSAKGAEWSLLYALSKFANLWRHLTFLSKPRHLTIHNISL